MAIATVRVRSATDTAGERPDPARMERAAALLQESGFEVLRIGRFGVNIKGDDQDQGRRPGVPARTRGRRFEIRKSGRSAPPAAPRAFAADRPGRNRQAAAEFRLNR